MHRPQRHAGAYNQADGRTFIPIHRGPTESVFVVFRPGEPGEPGEPGPAT